MSPKQQIYTTINSNNDQTVLINKHMMQKSNIPITRESRFAITDNNMTVRPVSRSTSRSRDVVIRDNSTNRNAG